MAQLWGGRFTGKTDQMVYDFNASITFDKRLFKQDIEGSIAHVIMLARQGIDVVVCSICMYSAVRAWNRANIANYKEIYIKVRRETLLSRNQKGLYTGGQDVVGVDLPFDEPKEPDLIIENDGGESPEAIVARLEAELL